MLTLRIVEQPAQYHRFRYETEIAGGKLGGLLYGRSGSKSCVRLVLSGADVSVHRSVIVIGGTVSPDGYPHPFYMHGESCESGAFQWRKDLTPADKGRAEFEIALEKVSLVCVPQVGDRLKEAVKRREAIQFNPFNKKSSEVKYTPRNARELRLVFQAYYVDMNGKTVTCKGAIAQTDIISDIKFQTKLEIEEIHPNEGLIEANEQEVWLLFKDTLPHFDQSQYGAVLDFEGAEIARCHVLWMKKQLMSVSVPRIDNSNLPPEFHRRQQQIERLKCCLRVVDLKSRVTAECDFVLSVVCGVCGRGSDRNTSGVRRLPDEINPVAQRHPASPPAKRSRNSKGAGATTASFDLLLATKEAASADDEEPVSDSKVLKAQSDSKAISLPDVKISSL